MSNKRCLIPFSVLQAEPFDLPWGSSIYAKVRSINVVGSSEFSATGNGAVILSIPSEPTDLENNSAVSQATFIAFTWRAPVHDGGSPIIDYRVYYDQGDPAATDFVVLESNIVGLAYTATPTLMGVTYRFKVAARNLMGYSIKSGSVSILAAQEPNKPSKPVTTLVGENVVITWTAPLDGGAPIEMYQIRIRLNDGVTY